uniref:Uncharacterized protein n=1 Tax=Anguilla anguilla TaxID=7936 RepID=A0A0E9RY19_ANGAN
MVSTQKRCVYRLPSKWRGGGPSLLRAAANFVPPPSTALTPPFC